MEDNKVLTEEEEEQVNGAASAGFTPNAKMKIKFCPNCNSTDVKEKTFTVDENNKFKVVYQCNSCGHVWEAYPTPVVPGFTSIDK